jgi:hypothetical protein
MWSLMVESKSLCKIVLDSKESLQAPIKGLWPSQSKSQFIQIKRSKNDLNVLPLIAKALGPSRQD